MGGINGKQHTDGSLHIRLYPRLLTRACLLPNALMWLRKEQRYKEALNLAHTTKMVHSEFKTSYCLRDSAPYCYMGVPGMH